MPQAQAFDQLYDQHFDAIFRYVLRRVANVAEAEDLTAQTFFKALRGFWRFRWTSGNPSAWLYRIAGNEINSHFRHRNSAAAATGGQSGHGTVNLDPTAETGLAAELADAEQVLAVNRLYLDLHQALTALKPDDQTLIVLRYFEQKSYEEIVPVLGGKPGALASRANRALKKLKTELQQRGIDHEELRGILAPVERSRSACGGLSAEAAP